MKRRCFLGLILLAVLPAGAFAAAAEPWRSAVRVKVEGNGIGSGTVIVGDPSRAVVLTCAHVFTNGTTPATFRARITIDLFKPELKGDGLEYLESHEGTCVDFDRATDVGLIQFKPGRRLDSSPVRREWPAVGQELTSVGCSKGEDATVWSTKVLGYQEDPSAYVGTVCARRPIPGRSGGGLFDQAGGVVGVCDFAEVRQDRGIYAGPPSIEGLIKRAGLGWVYEAAGRKPGAPRGPAPEAGPEAAGPEQPPAAAGGFDPRNPYTIVPTIIAAVLLLRTLTGTGMPRMPNWPGGLTGPPAQADPDAVARSLLDQLRESEERKARDAEATELLEKLKRAVSPKGDGPGIAPGAAGAK